MTEPTKRVETALQHPAVQRTLASLVCLFTAGGAIGFFLPPPVATPHGEATPGIKIDVNRAAARELALVPEVGPVLAKRIVADRLANGDYQTLEELGRVPGIGPKTLQHFRGLGVIDPPAGGPQSVSDRPSP